LHRDFLDFSTVFDHPKVLIVLNLC
jgi:hypothetical protein